MASSAVAAAAATGKRSAARTFPERGYAGISYANGRVLKFQVNKNRPQAPAVFTSSLRERHDGVRIYRTLNGTIPASGFTFPHSLRTATLSPPAPFSGQASVGRERESVLPSWAGDLALDFPGHREVPLAGPGAYVTLVHARFTRSDNGVVGIGFGGRSG